MRTSKGLKLPSEIKTREDIANFFAYVMVKDGLAFDTSAEFQDYTLEDRSPVFSRREAARRNALLWQAQGFCPIAGLDIDGIALDVLALTGLDQGYLDPRVKKEAPAWMKKLAKNW